MLMNSSNFQNGIRIGVIIVEIPIPSLKYHVNTSPPFELMFVSIFFQTCTAKLRLLTHIFRENVPLLGGNVDANCSMY